MGTKTNSIVIVGNIYPSKHEAGNIYDADGICPTIKCNGPRPNMKNICPKIQVKSATKDGYEEASTGDSINLSVPNSKTRRGRVGKAVAQTLDTQSNQAILLQGRIRRLTEIECERLQGFSDNHTKFGIYQYQVWINKKLNEFEIVEGVKEVPRTQRYKQVGNAVTTIIPNIIGQKLLATFLK